MLVDRLPESEYQNVGWFLKNGYRGQVLRRVESGYTLIKVNLQSDNFEWTDGPGVVFEYPTTYAVVPPITSGAIVVGVSLNNDQEQIVHVQMLSGKGKLIGNLGVSYLPTPASCPINTYFIIPK